jgi:hypothetical protein
VDHLQDAGYVRSTFALADLTTIIAILAGMVRGDKPQAVVALAFVRDVVTYGMVPGFRKHLAGSKLAAAMRYALEGPSFSIRSAAANTIGKIWLPGGADAVQSLSRCHGA